MSDKESLLLVPSESLAQFERDLDTVRGAIKLQATGETPAVAALDRIAADYRELRDAVAAKRSIEISDDRTKLLALVELERETMEALAALTIVVRAGSSLVAASVDDEFDSYVAHQALLEAMEASCENMREAIGAMEARTSSAGIKAKA